MREERLLERISNAVNGSENSGKTEQEIAVDSIIAHLKKLLNTRQGSAPIADDYGVPDIHSLASRFSTDPHESLEDIESGIENAISKYEPRLTSVRARLQDKEDYDISLTLEITGRLKSEQGNVSVELTAVITPGGRIEISSSAGSG